MAYHRIRMCIWKQWKNPKTKVKNLLKMGVPEDLAWQAGNSRKGYWFTTHAVAVNMAMTKNCQSSNPFLYSAPQADRESNTGFKLYPVSVSVYSTFGGTTG